MSEPHWPNACEHGDRPRDKFLGTTVDPETGDKLDVWAYQDNALSAPVPDMHVCIRYGPDGPNYYSPGNAERFVARGPVMPVYCNPVEMVHKYLQEERNGLA